VEEDLSLPHRREVFVIGDMAAFKAADGSILPGLASVAKQQGDAVARNIARDLKSRARSAFRYRDRGSMATMGRRSAVCQWGTLRLSKTAAWVLWAFVHAMLLGDFRTRGSVVREWAWSLMTRKTAARLITGSRELQTE
jgi:NADH dehydrogenase